MPFEVELNVSLKVQRDWKCVFEHIDHQAEARSCP